MKKSLRILIPLTIILALACNSSLINKIDFLRVNLSGKKGDQKTTEKKDYYFDEEGNNSYKGMTFVVSGTKKIQLHLNRNGNINVYFSLLNLPEKNRGSISYELIHKSGEKSKIIRVSENLKERIHISENLIFKKRDDLYIKLNGNGKVLISNPVISRGPDKLHVFFISIDTLRADFLEVYGNTDKISDNITRFSKDSVIFDNCFSSSSWTLPAHISLFTGRNVNNHYVYNSNMKLSEKIPIYPEALYKKSLVYSFNSGVLLDSKYGYYRGFDYYNSILWGRRKLNKRQSKLQAEEMFKKTQNLIESSTGSSTFFFLHTYQVHSPYQSHKGLKFSDKIISKGVPKQIEIPQGLGTAKAHGRKSRYRKQSGRKTKNVISLYKAEIEYFDSEFGKFIDYLKSNNIYNKSLIVIFSDHGEEFFEHKGWAHGHTLYNELTKIPLIIKFPGEEYKGKRISSNTGIIDIFPTLFDYLGIETEYTSDGKSLMALIKKGRDDNDRVIVSVVKGVEGKSKGHPKLPQKLSAVWKNYKLIYNFKYTEKLIEYYSVFPPPAYVEYELYNLKTDKNEMTNIISDPANRKVISFLKNKLNKVKRDIFNKKNKYEVFKISDKNKEKLKTLGYL